MLIRGGGGGVTSDTMLLAGRRRGVRGLFQKLYYVKLISLNFKHPTPLPILDLRMDYEIMIMISISSFINYF